MDEAGIEALGSRPIQERLSAIRAVRDLAASLDVAADSLYYHVRRLQKIGLLVVGARHRNGAQRPEAVVRLKSRRWRIEYDPKDRRTARAVLKASRVLLRQAQRDFGRGLRDPRAVARGPLRNLWALRLEGTLKPADVRRINRHLAGILKILRRAGRDPAEGLMAVSWTLAPIPSRTDGRRGATRPARTDIRGARRST